MIASLPMYLRPSNRAAHDRLWVLIRDGLRDRGLTAPDALDHDIGCMDAWARPDLVLSQICNLPYRARFKDKVTVIGAADYAIPGCGPGLYCSVFVVRKADTADKPEDYAGARFAYNDTLSNSGWAAPLLWARDRDITFRTEPVTGSHKASIDAVASGQADIAAIDAQTWWIESQDNPLAQSLKVIGTTDHSPGMSFITRACQDPQPYFAAVNAAISALADRDREHLNLRGIVMLPEAAYDLPLPPAYA